MRESGDLQMGEAIKAAREAKGLTRAQMATDMGLNDQYIYQVESGRRKPTLETLWEIALFLEIDPHSLDERLMTRTKKKGPK
jgi:transcriptional regulator with XRE-family HTH domain